MIDLRARTTGAPALAATVAGAVLVVLSAAIHLRLWGESDGYRQIPTVGPLFLAQGVVGCGLGVSLVAWRRVALATAGAAYMAASIGGLAVSVWFGLFGYHETMAAPYAGLALGVEIAGLVLLLVAAAAGLMTSARRPARPRQVVGSRETARVR